VTTVRPTWGEVFQVPPNTTGDDLLRLPDDGSKYELYEGVLVREMTSPAHGVICQRLGFTLGLYAQTTGVLQQQRIAQNALFDLTLPGMTTRTVLAPDLAILRLATIPSWSVPQDTPLLAIEVVSESQTLAELALKAQTYRQAGVEEVWVVDYKSRSIEVWSAQGLTTLHDTQTLTSALLPGFNAAVRFLLDG
jgi:Uma2 family endonuclease